MKTLITLLLILFSINIHSQHLIGKSAQELEEIGFVKYDDSTYISAGETIQVNTWLLSDEVILEQYVVFDQHELEELYIMVEDNFFFIGADGEDLYFESKNTGVTCVVNANTFTIFYKP